MAAAVTSWRTWSGVSARSSTRRSFGAFVTQKIKCYAYLYVFPGVSILLWKT